MWKWHPIKWVCPCKEMPGHLPRQNGKWIFFGLGICLGICLRFCQSKHPQAKRPGKMFRQKPGQTPRQTDMESAYAAPPLAVIIIPMATASEGDICKTTRLPDCRMEKQKQEEELPPFPAVEILALFTD